VAKGQLPHRKEIKTRAESERDASLFQIVMPVALCSPSNHPRNGNCPLLKGDAIMKNKFLAVFIVTLLTIGLFVTFALSADVPMMTKEELKAMLGNPDSVIFDVRHGRDFFSSDLKIKGAIRPLVREHIYEAIVTYPKGTTFVVYCASPNEEFSTLKVKHFLESKYEGYTKVYVLKGGWEEWLKAGYPTEKK
jgi:rhodanese-related sulfurtransferase